MKIEHLSIYLKFNHFFFGELLLLTYLVEVLTILINLYVLTIDQRYDSFACHSFNKYYFQLLNLGCSFCEKGFIKKDWCKKRLMFYLLLYLMIPLIWNACRVSITSGPWCPEEDQRNECREKAREFAHWRTSRCNWLSFLPCGILHVSATAQTPGLPTSVCIALLSKPSHATMPDFFEFSSF